MGCRFSRPPYKWLILRTFPFAWEIVLTFPYVIVARRSPPQTSLIGKVAIRIYSRHVNRWC